MSQQQLVRTAYGIKEVNNSALYIERAELVSLVNAALSVRGKNPQEFAMRLKELLLDYSEPQLSKAKYIEDAPIRVSKDTYKVRNEYGTIETITK